MDTAPQFPDDDNGCTLRRMHEEGDDLAEPRIVEFCYLVPQRSQALSFAEKIPERILEVCISLHEARDMWQVAVKHFMIPTHNQITEAELELGKRAQSVGGEFDGWGCMPVVREERNDP
jgi:hypothetical protein